MNNLIIVRRATRPKIGNPAQLERNAMRLVCIPHTVELELQNMTKELQMMNYYLLPGSRFWR